ncbi:unnamed protein product, partial [Symbiodinium necroappetens]
VLESDEESMKSIHDTALRGDRLEGCTGCSVERFTTDYFARRSHMPTNRGTPIQRCQPHAPTKGELRQWNRSKCTKEIVPIPSAPDQQRIEQDVEAAVPAGSSSATCSKTAQSGWDIAELASGPHLRGIVMVVSVAFWFAARTWLPQISMLPFIMLCTASTSALWCTPEGVVVSLGPVPICIFRRRIPYRDITSIVVVRGRKSVAVAMAKHLFRLWQPFGYVYALTLGKDVVDIRLRHCKEKQSADDISPAPAGSWLPWLGCSPCTLLVSVDK